MNEHLPVVSSDGSYQAEPSMPPDGRISMEEAAHDWLKTKTERTGSVKTHRSYKSTLAHFILYLQGNGCRLDSDPRTVGRHAQAWCATCERKGKVTLSTSTRNNRLAILSSFYQYAIKNNACDDNPIKYVERPPRTIEHAAPYLETSYVDARLKAIDTSTREGKRDKALLLLALTTGRRAKEIAQLRWKDLEVTGFQVKATFHCKGGKTMVDDLQPATIVAVLAVLTGEYGPQLERITAESPVFVCYSNNNCGGAMSTQALANICEKHLGVKQFHTTRHTFTVSMDELGASISEIGERLGHSNYNITANYMKRLKSSKNKYGRKLEAAYGLQ